jgi:DNA mismatch repair protein MutH
MKLNGSTSTFNAAAPTNLRNKKAWLGKTIENVIDVSSSQADKTIERLGTAAKLIVILRVSFETNDTLILNNSL